MHPKRDTPHDSRGAKLAISPQRDPTTTANWFMAHTEHLKVTNVPELDRPLMLAAWSGWSDAGECATVAVREIATQLNAQHFAAIDPEEFYIFTQERPMVRNSPSGERTLHWPKNDFYYWHSNLSGVPDLVLFHGTEPQLKWRTYTSAIASMAKSLNVELLANLGALLDSVPHTRAARVLCTSVDDDLGGRYEHVRYPRPNYEGPTGMTSATIDAFTRQGIKSVSIWGHAPHYLQVKRNPSITLAMLNEILKLAPLPINTAGLERDADEFDETISRAIESQSEIRSYVAQLEERYDDELSAIEDRDAGDLVQELDEFLKSRSSGNGHAPENG